MNEDTPRSPHRPRRKWLAVGAVCLVLLAVGGWRLVGRVPEAARTGPAPVVVVTALAAQRDVPVRLTANGTVTALQSVDLRSQITSTVKEVRIREGQNVRVGEPLFTLDAGTEEANLTKAHAQVEKDQSDFATAERNLKRQVELFNQKFISQAALDTAKNQVDTLTGQLAVDRAAVQAAQVALTYTEIRAPFAGRTGRHQRARRKPRAPTSNANTASAPPLVTVTQIDPIAVAFTLPEKELPGLQRALAAGAGDRRPRCPPAAASRSQGRVVFVDNAVDTTTGTIRLKAEFDNPKAQLWPGMFVRCRSRRAPSSGPPWSRRRRCRPVPTPASSTWWATDGKVAQRDVKLAYIEQGFAVVDGVAPGARVVVEGAQNLRPGSRAESRRRQAQAAGRGKAAVNLSELFIRRPVMTVLLSAAAVVAGVIAYDGIPIAALPQFDTPIIKVTARAARREPGDHGLLGGDCRSRSSSRPSPSLNVISSTTTLGQTSVTLEFDQDRDIDTAAVDVQAALLRAQRAAAARR